jgi:hypothetical protein
MAESFIKTDEHLPKVVTLHQRDWDKRLPTFLLAYTASTHDTMGLIPANLAFIGELRLPCNLLIWAPWQTVYITSTIMPTNI